VAGKAAGERKEPRDLLEAINIRWIAGKNMHISKVTLINYRNFKNATLKFNKGVNTIIGENGSGKTNLFRAVRLLLDDNMIRSAYRLDASDFHRGLGDWRGHWIIISLEFEEIGNDEAIQALFLHGTGVIAGGAIGRATYNLIFRPRKEIRQRFAELDDGDVAAMNEIRDQITIGDYETVFTGRSDANFGDEAVYEDIIGDFDNGIFPEDTDDPRIGARIPTILSVAKEVSFTFIQALRDVVGEFHNSRTNPLLTLLKKMSGEIDPAAFAPIAAKVQDLNGSIEDLDDVQTVRTDIRDTLKDAAGETYSPRSLSIRSDLSEEPEKLFQSLRLFIAESDEDYEGAINELSLGGANLIFLTLKLLEFKYQTAAQPIANFLLIEEPEAHIHTHIQKTLFDRIAYADTQIIYSTHSTHISEVSKVQSVNILGRRERTCEAYQPATGLSPDEVQNIQRYLDAVRSNLLFAKSVLLVEGDAEEILIPVLFKSVFGISLDELGVSLINIRSTGFKNVAILFHDARIRKRCSVITDLDAAFIDTNPVAGESEDDAKFKARCLRAQVVGARRKVELDVFVLENPWLSVHYADHTFEVDFISAGNATVVSAVIPKVYVQAATINDAHEDLTSGVKARYGRRVLTMAQNEGKGWFAILLGKQIDHKTVMPAYIKQAIFFARPTLSVEQFVNIYDYRIGRAEACGDIAAAEAHAARGVLTQYRSGAMTLADMKTAIAALLAGDQIHEHLADVQ
jgi:putative ATP-dependent endonuclease of OLD family